MYEGQHVVMHMLFSSNVGMQHAGVVQGAEGGPLPRVLAVAVASSVINQVTGPHSALTSPELMHFQLGLSATSSEPTKFNVYWASSVKLNLKAGYFAGSCAQQWQLLL